jgi:hypothetical protein
VPPRESYIRGRWMPHASASNVIPPGSGRGRSVSDRNVASFGIQASRIPSMCALTSVEG